MLVAAGLLLTLALIQHYLFHRAFVYQLFFMVSVYGPIIVWRYLDVAAQRRRARDQQAPTGEERGGSGRRP